MSVSSGRRTLLLLLVPGIAAGCLSAAVPATAGAAPASTLAARTAAPDAPSPATHLPAGPSTTDRPAATDRLAAPVTDRPNAADPTSLVGAPARTAQVAPPLVGPTAGGGPTGSMTRTQFIAAAVAPAQRSQREYGVPASVTIAQAILESGWGASGLSARDRNFFGMKCFDKGPIAIGCRSYATTECRADKTCYRTTASFRVYASATDSFRDHGRLLATSPRYRPAFAWTSNPNQFIAAVHRGGYATSPTYTTSVRRVMAQYNLYRYDLK